MNQEMNPNTTQIKTNIPAKIFFDILKYGLLISVSVIIILPILVIFIGAFKTGPEFNSSGAFDLPKEIIFDNFVTAFIKGKMLLGFTNTLIIIVGACVGSILTGTMAAYVLNRFKFKLNKIIRFMFLWIVLIPAITSQVSRFQIVVALGLYNTLAVGIVLAMGTDIIAIYIFLQFLDNIPVSLDEAAIVEGAGYFRIFFKIIMPLLKPAIVTVLIIKSIGIYNDFYTPFLYMNKPSLEVISTSLYHFKGPYGARWEVISAGIVIALLPTLIAFILLQKQIYNGLVKGAVKQ